MDTGAMTPEAQAFGSWRYCYPPLIIIPYNEGFLLGSGHGREFLAWYTADDLISFLRAQQPQKAEPRKPAAAPRLTLADLKL